MPTLPEAAVHRNSTGPADEILWQTARLYARAYGWFKDRTGHNLKGLGFLLRRLRSDRVFEACGQRWFFDHRIPGTYMRLVGGGYNEPETHAFLQFIGAQARQELVFVDVGANIGEMVVAMAARPNVARVIAFEPHPVCAHVCRENLALNRLSAEVHAQLVGDGSAQPYVIDPKYAPTSGIRRGATGITPTPTVRLDDVLAIDRDCVLLIDVEGAELDVLRGGRNFVRNLRPLVVFEYSSLIQRHLYTLDEVRAVLGDGYDLLRLRADGLLDRDLDKTWNCVAVHAASTFAPLCEKRMIS